ncbi:hypothetical protein C6P46_004364 [Rhodotorula mucilaginosa]|uniref:Signal recognition particle receptor subunit beta n=1 Tax=Rhodotorula mucilaginosa TaxID=5537 RepID=A0A9P6W849_RHOMI|nr:hypothetical protein C6P46_004364 [Rhodotorula mucilaginosa]TKA54998.1 hypothetical protein B0A53_02471 [Rhodotorula sp. CCFEE 5036]
MADPVAAAVTAPSPPRAPVPAAPEVLSLFAPASSLSPIRIFVSLCVLLVFLLVAFFSPPKKNNARNRGAKVAVSATGGSGKKKSAKTVLLVGPLAAGKTALFSKLAYGHVQPTHTSMKENETVITHKWNGVDKHELADEKSDSADLDPPLHLVDIPGHPRLRTRSLAQYLPAADGIVFTIDGAAGLTGKNVRDAAEHLHVLLSLLALQSTRQSHLPPLLILLTKSDMSASSSSSLANASGGTASPSSSSSNNKARSPTLALERAKQSLLRELERRRLASTGAGGGAPGTPAAAGSTPLSAGAKLEGLDAIPSSSSSSNGSQGLIRSFLSLFGLGNSSSTSSGIATLSEPIATSSMTGLPSDENEILSTAAEDVFAFEGSADWDKLANAVGGVEIQWKVASVVDGAGERGSEGVRGVYEWVQEL